MVATLRSELQKSGARLDSLTESVIQLNVLREALKRRVLTRNPTGRAAEYQLQLNVEMQLSRASSEPVSEIFRASRDYRYDNTQLLASHERENQLIDQMRVEIASSIAAYVSQVSKSANGI